MAYFKIEEVSARGAVRYKARVRNKVAGKDVGSKSKTFNSLADAEKWARSTILKLDAQLKKRPSDEPENVIFANFKQHQIDIYSKLSYVIDYFLALNDKSPKSICKSYRAAMVLVKDFELSNLSLFEICHETLLEFCIDRFEVGAAPSTVRINISAITKALENVSSIFKIDFDFENYYRSINLLKKEGFLKGSKMRERRLIGQEYEQLKTAFFNYSQSEKVTVPYAELFDLYIFTTLRRNELIKISWSDIDFDKEMIKVYPNKSSQYAIGDSRNIRLTDNMKDAFAQIANYYEMRNIKFRDLPQLFSLKPSTMTTVFNRLTNQLKIKDLRLHDLRAEGISRLLEQGYTVPQVAVFSGHRDLKMIEIIYNRMQAENIEEPKKLNRL